MSIFKVEKGGLLKGKLMITIHFDIVNKSLFVC